METDTEQLVGAIVRGMQEKKGFDIITADLSAIASAPARYFVICSGNTPQQVTALAGSVAEFARKEAGEKPATAGGLRNAEWVVMDYGTVIAHIFVPASREYYDLENLWDDAALRNIPNLD